MGQGMWHDVVGFSMGKTSPKITSEHYYLKVTRQC